MRAFEMLWSWERRARRTTSDMGRELLVKEENPVDEAGEGRTEMAGQGRRGRWW